MNLDLFEAANVAVMPDIKERVEKAVSTLLALFRRSVPIVVAFSGGKDSASVAALTLMAAKAAVGEGLKPLVVVSTGDTLIESPEITAHYRVELRKMVQFGKRHGFAVHTKIVQPALASTFQVRVLTGRGLSSFPGGNADCSVDLKQSPMVAWRKAFFKSLQQQGLAEPTTVLGLRYSESEKRRVSMMARQDNDREPVRNKAGDLVLSPIAFWLEDDVWDFLGESAAGTFGPCYSDFSETRRIYAHAAGTSCAVVADSIAKGRARGGCGARTGCSLCLMAEDKSMENMLEFDPRYGYMRGLNRLNKFLRATRYDWNRRHWVGRRIMAGYIAIEPDTYHPRMVRELARYMMQLDHDENRASGGFPRFCLLPAEMLVAIDALWSLNGLAKPFAIWKDWSDIHSDRVRYDVPTVDEYPQAEMPETRFLAVGRDWDDDTWAGMRDSYFEGVAGECLPAHRELPNGNSVWDIPHADKFDVDVEAVSMLMDFELDRLIEKANCPIGAGGITAAYKYYLTYGALQLAHSQVAKHDEILRRTAFKDRMGLTLEYDVSELLAKTVAYRDLPDEARVAWRHKASDQSAQVEFALAA